MGKPLRITLAAAAATVVVSVVAVVVWPAEAASAGLENPGFESGLSGWSCASTVTVDTGHAHSGSRALFGTPTSSDNAQCTQSVQVTPGTAYTLAAHVDGSYVFLGATAGASASTWTPATGGSYQRLETTFTTSASATTVTVTINGWYGQPAFHVDDVTLTSAGGSSPNPSPSRPPVSPGTPSASATPSPSLPGPTSPQPSLTPSGPGTGPAANLAACQHFSSVVPPERSVGPARDAVTQAGRVELAGRLPAPGNIRGTLANGAVTLSFDRVPGAVAYRVWRNAQSVLRIEDWGQSTLSITDASPCRQAYYTVAALRGDDGAASIGQLSQPFRLADSGVVAASPLAVGTRVDYRVTAYNDAGQTASGYQAGLGLCAVDARYIPWGTRLKIEGYGYCYAADIGTWIQGDIVDVWLPGAEAEVWGVQKRTVTVV